MADVQDKTAKVWKANTTSAAGMVVSDTQTLMVGDSNNVLAVDNKGITIAGAISFVADAANIRRGGLFTGLNDFTDMIPSTIVTPIPKQIPVPPIVGLVGIGNDVAFFMSLLA